MPTIAVLLPNKLIACDTIVPLVAELLRRYPGTKVEFICFDAKTAKVIRSNVVLWDVIQALGPLRQLGRDKGGRLHLLAHRARSVFRLGRLMLMAATGRMSFLHFKALNFWPLRFLASLAPGRVVYAQGSAIGVTELEQRVSDAMMERNRLPVLPVGDMLLGFTSDWAALHDTRLSERDRCELPAPFTYATWVDHVRARADNYFAALFAANALADAPTVVTYILSSMDENGLLREPHLFSPLFEETLDALEAADCRDPILVKPHPAMRPKYQAFIREAAARRPNLKVVFCDLHPMVLALRSRFVIGNCYSTTFSVFAHLGIPTVEYTSYRPDILDMTEGGSMRPGMVTHFIDSDRSKLDALLAELTTRQPDRSLSGHVPDFPPALLAALGIAPPPFKPVEDHS